MSRGSLKLVLSAILLVVVCAAVGFWTMFMFSHFGLLPTGAPLRAEVSNIELVDTESFSIESGSNPIESDLQATTTSATSSVANSDFKATSMPAVAKVASRVTATSSTVVVPVVKAPVVQAPAKKVFKLNVPFFMQQYRNSCEAGALRMALAFYGIAVNDIELIAKMGYRPRPKDILKNEWDDPREMYVGEVDVVDISKGYGVYGQPVARAAQAYGRSAEFVTGVTPEFLAKEIQAGHPIVLWGYTSFNEPAYTWNTPAGKTVTAFKGEHARVVVGYEGDVSNPTGFFMHDPTTGKQYEYWSRARLMQQVNAVPEVTNQAVVVR